MFRNDECNPAPTPLPRDFEGLASALATCEVATNDAYDARISEYAQRPDFSHAGACHPSPTQ